MGRHTMPKEDRSSDRSFDDLARALAEGTISRRRALKLFVGSALAALIPSRALAQPKKETICHKPGTPEEKTMEVPKSAVDGHLRHGDHLGPCGTTTTTTTAAPTTTTTTSTSTSTTSTSTTPTCRPIGSDCTAGSQCCTANCDGTCCIPEGTSAFGFCDTTDDCCVGLVCIDGICII